MNNQRIVLDRSAYLTAVGLSVFVSFLFLALIIIVDVRQTYWAMSHVAREVVIANVEFAKQVCFEASLKVFLYKLLCLAPAAALLSSLMCCLSLRAFSKEFRTPSKREIVFCLLPVPLISLMVFFWSPRQEFQLPFNTLYWRTAKAEERGRLVPWLIRSFKFQGMDKESLEASLGEPDFDSVGSGSGYIGYKTGGAFKLQNCIFFYFGNNGKASFCQTGGEKNLSSSFYD